MVSECLFSERISLQIVVLINKTYNIVKEVSEIQIQKCFFEDISLVHFYINIGYM